MDKYIRLSELDITDNKLSVHIGCSPDIKRYFLTDRFYAEYEQDITYVDDSILYIPAVASIIPVAWALGATVTVPLAAWAGWRLGHMEARGVLAGIGLGTGPVVQTAEKIATVKASAARQMKQEPLIVELPRMIDVTPKRLQGGNDQVVM